MNRDNLKTKLLMGAACAAAFFLTLSSAQAQATRHHRSGYDFTAPDQVTQRSFSLGSTPLVKVDNVNGPITVVADGGAEIRLTATESIFAESQGLVAEAQRDVKLQISQTSDSVDFYVDGPFRCHDGDHGCNWDNPGYETRFAFELHVPTGARVDVKTVNDGDITVRGVRGGFLAHNINGGLDIEDVAGSGEARTINGKVKAVFAANPTGNCAFATLNGEMNVYFPAGLNAVLRYKSFNGAVYSDFEVQPLAATATVSSRDNGRRVIRSNQFNRGQVGTGGPEITLDGFNGNVYIHRVR
ncbi:MAG TPA: hypothetical protein VFP94_04325 [Terriglobales bacterium]|nr:hypothetical protein [Terriglobales bacterium]